MKTRQIYVRGITYLFLMLAGISGAQAGNTDGGGGDPQGIEAVAVAERSLENAARIGDSLISGNDLQKLREILPRYRVVMIETDPIAVWAKTEQKSAGYSERTDGSFLTKISRGRWGEINSEWQRQAFMFHELCVLAGLEATGKYNISARFVELVNRIKTDRIRRAVERCKKKEDWNGGWGDCYAKGTAKADTEIARKLKYIKNVVFSGEDGHGRTDWSHARQTLDKNQKLFLGLRQSAENLAALADGGTGSDQYVASQRHVFEITLTRLEELERLFPES